MYVLQHTKNLPNMGGMDIMGHRASMTPSVASSGDFSQESESGRHRQGPYLEGNMKLLATVECPTVVMCNRFSDDGSLLAVGLIDGSIKVYETEPLTCHCIHSLQDDETVNAKLPATQIRFKHFEPGDKPEHKRVIIASYASGMVKVWHYTTGKCLHTINEPEQSQIFTLSINPENSLFCMGGDDPRIHLYDMETLKKVSTLQPSPGQRSDGRDIMDGHQCRVFALMYHPTIPHVFISGGWDDTVQYWDDRMKHAQRHISG
ncbi:WD repeat-containing protein wdr-5.1-like, partial [Mercenaria mercenaria]|uniref:WD repeat-containing protein wdr-5.1-like n=1 Tax=Mercenaria mercenaria TaxID=6596 RepID=UPI00234EF36B